MSDGKRPGGLTALAVLNFVFGGLGALGLLALFAMLDVAHKASSGESTQELVRHGSGLVWTSILLGTLTTVLMIAAGVGYLGQKRVLGRMVGNGYAIVSLGSSVVGFMLSGFGMMTLIGLIYPLLTVILLNTTFKDDLVN
jgi:hypothetical protein